MNNKFLLAFDPGNNRGWAVLDESGLLRACGLGWGPLEHDFRHVVIELPQVYPNTPVKMANDLIKVAVNVGELVTRYPFATRHLVHPHDWKGSTPKRVNCARILNSLGLDEVAVIPQMAASLKHNVIDAIGLAKWAFPKRSYLAVYS